jgi:hypothetical protein
MAQTFTAVHNGMITGAQVGIAESPYDPLTDLDANITARITDVDSSGAPADVLASTTIPGSAVTGDSYDPTLVSMTFENPPEVTAGQQYALTLESNASDDLGIFLLQDTSGTDSYSGGLLWNQTNGEPWGMNVEDSIFAIYVTSPCTFDEIQSPVNNVSGPTDDGMSAYKYGSRGVIAAKFKAACNGDPIDTRAEADAHPMKLTLTRLATTSEPEAVVEDTVTGSANTGDLFRFDDASDSYTYNIGAKSLARGTYKIRISEAHADGSHDEWFSIK